MKEIPQLENVRSMQVGKLRNCLCIIDSRVWRYLHVWIMNNYGVKESWSRLFTVGPKQLLYASSVRFLGLSVDGEQVLMQLNFETLVWVDVREENME
ncbi:hypothetical protein LINPERHAP2_LOCUS30662 [Linum perenne]